MRILLTGSSGYIASLVLPRLLEHPRVEQVIGLDLRPTALEHPKLLTMKRDLADRLTDDLYRWKADTLVHLAFVLTPSHWGHKRARRANLRGSRRILEGFLSSGGRRVIWFSSTAAYGAHPDNPPVLTEEDDLAPNLRFPYARYKAETDSMARRTAQRTPGTRLTLLRGCPVLGPRGGTAVQGWFSKPFFPQVSGANPPLQFIHEDDLAEIMVRCVVEEVVGVYNVTGDGTITLSETAEVLGKRLVPLPAWLIYPATSALWWLGLSRVADAPGAGIDFIRYPWVASNDRIKRALGIERLRTAREAVEAYVRGRTQPLQT